MNFPQTWSADGFVVLGSVALSGTLIVGDPSLFDDPTLVWSGSVRPGLWRLMMRTEGDTIVEVVAILEEQLTAFYEVYDAVQCPIFVSATSGRIALMDAAGESDLSLRKDLLEIEDFPWVFDFGCVAEASESAWIFAGGEGEVCLVSLAFGERPHVAVDRVPSDS